MLNKWISKFKESYIEYTKDSQQSNCFYTDCKDLYAVKFTSFSCVCSIQIKPLFNTEVFALIVQDYISSNFYVLNINKITEEHIHKFSNNFNFMEFYKNNLCFLLSKEEFLIETEKANSFVEFLTNVSKYNHADKHILFYEELTNLIKAEEII